MENTNHCFAKAIPDTGNGWVEGCVWLGENDTFIIPLGTDIEYYPAKRQVSALACRVRPETISYRVNDIKIQNRPVYTNDIVMLNDDTLGIVISAMGMFGVIAFGKNTDSIMECPNKLGTTHISVNVIDIIPEQLIDTIRFFSFVKLIECEISMNVAGNIFDNADIISSYTNAQLPSPIELYANKYNNLPNFRSIIKRMNGNKESVRKILSQLDTIRYKIMLACYFKQGCSSETDFTDLDVIRPIQCRFEDIVGLPLENENAHRFQLKLVALENIVNEVLADEFLKNYQTIRQACPDIPDNADKISIPCVNKCAVIAAILPDRTAIFDDSTYYEAITPIPLVWFFKWLFRPAKNDKELQKTGTAYLCQLKTVDIPPIVLDDEYTLEDFYFSYAPDSKTFTRHQGRDKNVKFYPD